MMSQRDYGHGLARMSPYSRPMQPRQAGLSGGNGGSSSAAAMRPAGSSKIDPSFKSKRYRDKLREQIKALETLLPIDKATLHRKLDSQTVFRLVISYFRTKIFFQAAGLSKIPLQIDHPESEEGAPPVDTPAQHIDIKPIISEAPSLDENKINESLEARLSLEALDGFVLVVTSDGTILYSTDNISSHLGFHQVDLVHRCLYGIVHPDDHHELKVVLEQTLPPLGLVTQSVGGDSIYCESAEPKSASTDSQRVSFLCRMKCFNGTNTGFVKMHCCGIMHAFPGVVKSTRTSCQVLLAVFRPFSVLTLDTDMDFKQNVFCTKHDMDMKFKVLDERAQQVLGCESGDLEGQSLYSNIHPDDLAAVYTCHKTLMDLDEIYTLYLRIQKKDGSWLWLHSRAKVVIKNSRKHTIAFTHCPVREEDSSYLQQEARARNRYGLEEYLRLLTNGKTLSTDSSEQSTSQESAPKRRWTSNDTYVVASQSPYKLKDDYSVSLHSPHGVCPSSYHQSSERHSPVYPSTYAPHRYQKAAQGSAHHEEHMSEEAPAVTVSYYDFTHRSECMGNPVHPQPQPHPALSMYQMVAHLPPEMYDAESYCKHAYRMMETNQSAGPGQSLPHYQLPLTPQTSPHSYYQQGQYQSHYSSDHMVPSTPTAIPMSPPPSPGSYKAATACMYTGEIDDTNKPIVHPMSQLECCMPPKSEYYASYVVNGALQVKLIGGAPATSHGVGYARDFLHEQYTPLTDCMYTQCRLEVEHEMKPFQMSNPYRKLASQCIGPCMEEKSTQHPNGYRSSVDLADQDSDGSALPCPMANTKNGCLATSRLVPINGYVKEIDPSTLPPINSFLDFLNEELPPPVDSY